MESTAPIWDDRGVYKAMNRAEAIRVFERDVVERLRTAKSSPVNIGYVLYYSYDSAAKSTKCDASGFNQSRVALRGVCVDGVIDPTTGKLLPDVASAVVNAARPID